MIRKVLSIVAVLVAIGGMALAASPQDADRLGKDLTPAGAEKAGNKEGTIPEWSGKDVPLPGWSFGKYRGDFWQYKDEKPLFVIDASNVDKYADKLSKGQAQFIKQTEGYKMEVYPTHRNAGYPDWVLENVKKNATGAKLSPDGDSLLEASLPGIPFPIPQKGEEVMWNYMTCYTGVGIIWPETYTVASPSPGSSEWIETHGPQILYFPWGAKGSNSPSSPGQVLFSIYFAYDAPPALAGQAVMQSYYFNNKPCETFYYFPGQRRVRRMPAYAYDAPQIGFENQYTLDQPWLFIGNLDRFDWKITGKKELYVPYNCFGMFNFNQKLHEVLLPKFLNSANRRYELHRVWVIEATVKQGMRHTAPKKIFYVDEDSWLVLVGEDYDAHGGLWKMREGYPIPAWELGGTFELKPFVQYDLLNGRYVQDQTVFSVGKDMQWLPETNDPRFKSSYFTGEKLRAICER
jgi:hypothetical protein